MPWFGSWIFRSEQYSIIMWIFKIPPPSAALPLALPPFMNNDIIVLQIPILGLVVVHSSWSYKLIQYPSTNQALYSVIFQAIIRTIEIQFCNPHQQNIFLRIHELFISLYRGQPYSLNARMLYSYMSQIFYAYIKDMFFLSLQFPPNNMLLLLQCYGNTHQFLYRP